MTQQLKEYVSHALSNLSESQMPGAKWETPPALYCRIPFLWHSGKATCRSEVTRGWGGWCFTGNCHEGILGGDRTAPSEKAMAPHSSTLAWKIPWMEEPGRLWSMGSLRVGHDWTTSLSLFTFTRWKRKWQPTPMFLPGESQGRGSLVGCRLWDHTESDTTEAT